MNMQEDIHNWNEKAIELMSKPTPNINYIMKQFFNNIKGETFMTRDEYFLINKSIWKEVLQSLFWWWK